MRDERANFSWPPAVQEAVIVDEFPLLTYSEQMLEHVSDCTADLDSRFQEVLDNFINEPYNGRIEMALGDRGNPNPNEYIISLGSTVVSIELDDNMDPKSCAHYFELQEDPVRLESECSMIVEVLEAVIYKACPQRVLESIKTGKKYLRNGHTVTGVQDRVKRIVEDSILLNNALAGVNIKKEDVKDAPVR